MPSEASVTSLSTTPVAPKASASSDQHPAGPVPPGAVIFSPCRIHFWDGGKLKASSQQVAERFLKTCYPEAHFSHRMLRTVVWEREYDRIGDFQGRYAVAEIRPITLSNKSFQHQDAGTVNRTCLDAHAPTACDAQPGVRLSALIDPPRMPAPTAGRAITRQPDSAGTSAMQGLYAQRAGEDGYGRGPSTSSPD